MSCGAEEAPSAPSACPVAALAPSPTLLDVGATDGELALEFDVTVHAQGGGGVQSATLDGSVGSVVIDGARVPAVLYERVPWPAIGATLYQGLAVAGDQWWVLWFYCKDGALSTTYFETTGGGGARVVPGLRGSCVEGDAGRSVHVSLPSSRITLPRLAGGYRVDGPDLSINCEGTGRMRLGPRELEVYTFAAIDCSACSSASGFGWRELHAILWDPAARRACFGIFYLLEPGTVGFEYALSLPDLGDPGPASFSATWETP